MGVALTIVTADGHSTDYHVSCGHLGCAYTWYVSSDRIWLIIKSQGGVPRAQVPMSNVRELRVNRCEGPPPERNQTPCSCGKVKLDEEQESWREPGVPYLMHMRPPAACGPLF